MEERQALARLRRGDLAGLEPLVRAHQLRAVRAAALIVRDRALAEDLVQAAFLRAAERIAQLDPGRPFGPWFLRSVVNDALKAAARRERQVSLDDEPDEGGAGLAGHLADPALDPAALAELAETRQAVWAALGRLSPRQRAAVVLRYYLELDEAEVAARLQAAPGTIKWHLHQARARLRQLLHPLAPARNKRREERG
ncbi:MAG: sigma-70 family RNA polymerase sigma factor [Anaerolineales bacterium]|nr:sigma-70 family RNA polymerase sigma factor [Anaerolineales bacterium]